MDHIVIYTQSSYCNFTSCFFFVCNMGIFRFLLCVIMLMCAIILYSLKDFLKIFSVPEKAVIEDIWWGSGYPEKEDKSVYPFKINISQEMLDDLQFRLEHTRHITEPIVDDQSYGLNGHLAKEILEYWKTEYNWREREKYLNKFPQFTTSIQGLKIHFLHVKPKDIPKNIKVLPIFMLHGWPSSAREFYKIIPILTKPNSTRNFVFEVVAADLPGFAFSDSSTKPGLGATAAALIYKKLMTRLGFEKFYVQGGDLGSLVLHAMTVNFEESVLGFHNNMCNAFRPISLFKMAIGSLYPSWIGSKQHQELVYPLTDLISLLLLEFGHLHLHSTKPDSLGISMNDSPMGIAAYHIEKFSTGTNWNYRFRKDGGLKEKYTYDDMLDQVMLFWVNKCATTAFRFYAEIFNKKEFPQVVFRPVAKVPVACSRNKYDVIAPDGTIHDSYKNLVFVTDNDAGHFPAMEAPHQMAIDIFDAVERMEVVIH